MLKAIFISLGNDIVSFTDAYFCGVTRRIWRRFFDSIEKIRKIFRSAFLTAVGVLLIFILFALHLAVWLAWILLPLVVSALLYYGILL